MLNFQLHGADNSACPELVAKGWVGVQARWGDAGVGEGGLMSSGYHSNGEGTSGGGSRGGSVTVATDGAPSSLGLEMQLSLLLITCPVLEGLGKTYKKYPCYHLHIIPI